MQNRDELIKNLTAALWGKELTYDAARLAELVVTELEKLPPANLETPQKFSESQGLPVQVEQSAININIANLTRRDIIALELVKLYVKEGWEKPIVNAVENATFMDRLLWGKDDLKS